MNIEKMVYHFFNILNAKISFLGDLYQIYIIFLKIKRQVAMNTLIGKDIFFITFGSLLFIFLFLNFSLEK